MVMCCTVLVLTTYDHRMRMASVASGSFVL